MVNITIEYAGLLVTVVALVTMVALVAVVPGSSWQQAVSWLVGRLPLHSPEVLVMETSLSSDPPPLQP